jgi:hypothetical protein
MKPKENTEVFELEILTGWLESDDLLVTISKDVDRTIANVRPFIELMQRLTKNGRKICILTDGTLAIPFPVEVREYVNAASQKYVKAWALFSDSRMGNAMGFIQTTLNNGTQVMKVCANEQEAREWLKDYLS